jgi:hypothetical protein
MKSRCKTLFKVGLFVTIILVLGGAAVMAASHTPVD